MARKAWWRWLVFLAACGGEQEPATSLGPSCDPLVAETSATSLQHVVIAGRAVDGTIYVVTEADGATFPQRVFVSEGNVLREHAVGQAGGAESVWTLSGTGTPPITLSRTAWTPPDDHWETIAVGAETLTPVPEGDLAGFAVVSVFTPSVVYDQSTNTERILLVSKPTTSLDDYRVFFGSSSAVRERTVRSITRDSAGNLTVAFDADGADHIVNVRYDSALYGAEPRVAGVHFSCL